MSFFSASAGSFAADRLDDPQLDDPARQQPQRPVRVAGRGRPQTQAMTCASCSPSSSLGLGATPAVAFQRPLEPLQHASLANVPTVFVRHEKASVDPLVGPRRPVRIGLQENLRAAHLLAAPLELANRPLTDLAFLSGESNDVLFCGIENSLGSRRVPR